MPGRSPIAALEGTRRLEALRFRGHKGGVIAPHRAMVGLRWTTWRFSTTLVLALGGLAGFLALLPRLGQGWQLLFLRARDFLGLGVPIGDQTDRKSVV